MTQVHSSTNVTVQPCVPTEVGQLAWILVLHMHTQNRRLSVVLKYVLGIDEQFTGHRHGV